MTEIDIQALATLFCFGILALIIAVVKLFKEVRRLRKEKKRKELWM